MHFIKEIKKMKPQKSVLAIILATTVTMTSTTILAFASEQESIFNGQEISMSQIFGENTAKAMTLTMNGKSTSISTNAKTVGELLASRNITLKSNETLLNDKNAPITENMEVRIAKVETKTVTESVWVPYTEQVKNTDSLYKGTTKVVQDGVDGEKLQTVQISYVDGVEQSRTVVSETVVKEALPKITEIGTKEKKTVKTNKGTFEYSKVVTCKATAYEGSAASNGKWAGQTATGMALQRGVIAVDPRVIPLRSKVYVEAVDGSWSYGYAVAGDTGGAIKGNRVDLFMNTEYECEQFGVRQCKVYILK